MTTTVCCWGAGGGECCSMGASSWNLDAGGGGVDGGKGKTGRAGVAGRCGVTGRCGVDGRGGVTSCTGASRSSRSRAACRADVGGCGSARAVEEAEAVAACRKASEDMCERSGSLMGSEVPKVNSWAQSDSSPCSAHLAPLDGERERVPSPPLAEPGREPLEAEPGREVAAGAGGPLSEIFRETTPAPPLAGAGAVPRAASGGAPGGRVGTKEDSLVPTL
mmetsp:Transcript_114875/g.357852  ORF Transcript_114875/g.357852 Transcript_114875/m.357852 type:complete len:220 (-) Transcript_114875:16-675(-)